MEFFGLAPGAVIDVPGRTFPVEAENVTLKDEPLTIRNDILKR